VIDQDEGIAILVGLGLTTSQAMVFLTLSRLGKATAKAITESSQLARQEVYRILSELRDKGLVEKIIAKPTKYRLVSIENALDILLQRKKEENFELDKKTTLLLNYCKHIRNEAESKREEANDMVIVPKKEAYIRKLAKATADCLESIDIITTRDRSYQGIMTIQDELAKEAVARGVRIRMIADEPCQLRPEWQKKEMQKQDQPFQVRYIHRQPPTALAIHDKKSVGMVTSCNTLDWYKATTFWSDNPRIVSMIQEYFDLLWNTAKTV
jgi:sugar-specific transcriptional regulator TrmB